MAKFQCNVISYVLKRTVDISVVIPTVTIPESLAAEKKQPTHIIKEKYPVLYLLHGFGNNHATWSGYSNIELFAEEQNIAVVMISGENKSYRTLPGEDDFFKFVSEEVPEFVTNIFPISKEAKHSYIAGLSMGGYGAMLHGLSFPEKFAAIGTFSGAVGGMGTKEEKKALEGSPLDLAYLVKKNIKENKKIPPIYISCGEEDFVYNTNVKFSKYLKDNSVERTWVSVPKYKHEWRFWNYQVEEFLKWIPRCDSYAKQGARQV